MPYTGQAAEVVAAIIRPVLGSSVPVTVGGVTDDPPDVRVFVFDTTAVPDGRYADTGLTVTHPGCQVRFRGLSYPAISRQANAVKAALLTVRNQTVTVGSEQAKVGTISVTGDPIYMGTDAGNNNRRQSFVLNVTVSYQES